MVEFKRSNNKSIPAVIFSGSRFKLEVSNWFDLKMPVDEVFGLLLLKIGFSADDVIVLKDYDSNNKSFNCIVNNDKIYDIKFNNLNPKFDNMEIVKSYDNHEYGYSCQVLSVAELGARIKLAWHREVLSNGVIFSRDYSRDYVRYVVQCKDYVLEFKVGKPDNLVLPIFAEDGHYAKYELDNKDTVVEYLSNLTFPVSIVDLYKDLCNISLGNVNRYSSVLLSISRSNRVTDLIDLKYGDMQKFVLTRDNKIVTLNDVDKITSCNILDNSFDYSVSRDNGINCSFNARDVHELSKFTSSYVFDNVMIAKRETGRVRKLARELFFQR